MHYILQAKGKQNHKSNKKGNSQATKLHKSPRFWKSRQYSSSETLLTIKMQTEFAKVIKLERWELIKF